MKQTSRHSIAPPVGAGTPDRVPARPADEVAASTGSARISSMRSTAARPAWPAWYSSASRRSGAKNSGVSTSTARAVPNDRRSLTRRKLTWTATRAVAAVAAHSMTRDVWNAVRSTSMVESP